MLLPPLLDGPADSELPPELYALVVECLRGYIGRGRIVHVEGVAASAVELARRYAPDLTRRAQVAGLLHDNAKKLTGAQLIELAARFDIVPSPAECETPQLLHGAVGAALLPQRFGVDDPEIAAAVADHVTGQAQMGLLSQILYVADQIEPGRDFPGVDELRELARRDLRAATALAARKKIEYVLLKGQALEPRTVEVWNTFRS